ncbi:MAG: SRPBCC family protein [Pseudomonadota bacterium]|nr:SRPBCC family protein [Pseudomonadota bacterium]
MSALIRLATGLTLLAAVLVAVAFALPRHVVVARSIDINAPESDVFPYVNNLEKFLTWSPWAAFDPKTVYQFTGPEQGKGAHMQWKSDHPQVGTGSQEIVESKRNEYVQVALDFGDMGKASAHYRLAPSGAGTRVTWGFDTDLGNNPLSRWMGLMVARGVAQDYERGLERLKKRVEAGG